MRIWLPWLRTTRPLIRMLSLASTPLSPWPESSKVTLSPSSRSAFMTWKETAQVREGEEPDGDAPQHPAHANDYVLVELIYPDICSSLITIFLRKL